MCADELDPDRLSELFDLGIDEVSWKKQHNYLTLVADHRAAKIVWGCPGAGEKAADAFFADLDPGSPRAAPPTPPGDTARSSLSARAHHGADQPEPPVAQRAAKLEAISLDMGPGYAAAARWHAPQAVVCIDPYHVVQSANKALDEVRRAYWNELRQSGDQQAAKRFKDARWSLLKAPTNLTDKQALTLRRLKAAGGEVWRAYTLKEATRAIFAPGLTVKDVAVLIDRLLSRLARSRLDPLIRLAKTIRKHRDGILAAVRLNINKAAPKRSTTRSDSSSAAPTASTPPRPPSPSSCSPAARSPFTCPTSRRRPLHHDTDHIDAERSHYSSARGAT
ncbi:MAG: transposase [Solirubrobacteraceae bacterium MAG38_C4-C5]|nr:transposase [Candidatus Siliceabacter maunaloa]